MTTVEPLNKGHFWMDFREVGWNRGNLRKYFASIPLYVKAMCGLGCKLDYHTVERLTCK